MPEMLGKYTGQLLVYLISTEGANMGFWPKSIIEYALVLYDFEQVVITRGQYWPPGIVVACVCPSVRQPVRSSPSLSAQ